MTTPVYSASGPEAERIAEILPRFEAHWAALGAPVERCLRPGLSDAQIDALSAELLGPDLVLPESVRAIYRWHDGSTILLTFGPNWLFSSLREVLTWYRASWRPLVEEFSLMVDIHDMDELYPRALVPIFGTLNQNVHLLVPAGPMPRLGGGVFMAEDLVGARDSLTHYSLLSLLEVWLSWFDAGYLSREDTSTWPGEVAFWTAGENLHWQTLRSALC